MFSQMTEYYKERFPLNDTFEIFSGDELRFRIKASNVPNKPGCYIIYKNNIDPTAVIYIGKSGTMKADGAAPPFRELS